MSQSVPRPAAPRLRRILLALVLILPLIAGTVVAAAGDLDPARSWSTDGEPSGAPAAAGPAGVDPADLVDARRAAGEASTQAGFLTSGTTELTEGTGQMREGAAALPDQFGEAVSGAQQLADGLVQLQAGTGQLGTGATEVADGVGQAVDQVIGLGALQGQLVEAIDRAVRELEDADDPRLVEARDQLTQLRDQVEAIQLRGPVAEQLTSLKDGAREVADQLSVPGRDFHDGVYSATRAAQDLAYGLSQAQTDVDEAVAGVESLDEGAQRLDQMAAQTDEKVGAVQRALPVVQAAPESPDGEAGGEGLGQSLTPLFAMFIAALVMLGGAGLGALTRLLRSRRALVLIGGTLCFTGLGLVSLLLVASGLTVSSVALAGLVLALGVLAAAALTVGVLALAGPVAGGIIITAGGILQVGIVGWVWRSVAVTELAVGWQIAANLLPLNWTTSALTTVSNDGSGQILWLAVGVLALIAVAGTLAGHFLPAVGAGPAPAAVTGGPVSGEPGGGSTVRVAENSAGDAALLEPVPGPGQDGGRG